MAPHVAPSDRIVVLGGSGFIGSHLIPALTRAGMTVANYDLYEPISPLPDGVQDIRGDIRDAARLTEVLQGADAVVNLAAAHHDFGLSEATFTSVNVEGARALSAAMTAAGVRNLCFYSSVAVYGDKYPEATEADEPAPVNTYGATKLLAEGVYRQWEGQDESRRALIIRPAVVFGPRNFANMYRMINQVARRRFVPAGSGHNRKAMVYVENVVAAIVHLWSRPPQVRPEVYNFVDLPHLESTRIIELVYRGLGRRPPRAKLPLKPAILAAKPLDWLAAKTGKNLPITSARIEKIGSVESIFSGARLAATDFTPARSLEEGIARMVTWYNRSGRYQKPVDHLPPEEPVIT